MSILESKNIISSEHVFIKPSIMFPVVATYGYLPTSNTGQHIGHFPDLPSPRLHVFLVQMIS